MLLEVLLLGKMMFCDEWRNASLFVAMWYNEKQVVVRKDMVQQNMFGEENIEVMRAHMGENEVRLLWKERLQRRHVTRSP